jgi:hypothetical protein
MTDFQDDPKYRAFLTYEAEIRAVGRDDIRHQTLDPLTAISTIFGALARAEKHAEDIAKLPLLKHAWIASVAGLASAVLYLDNARNSTTRKANEVASLAEEGSELVEVMSADVRAMMTRKVLPADSLAEYEPGNGYRNLAHNLGMLAGLCVRHWSTIEGRSGITKDDVTRASMLNEEILKVLGARVNDNGEASQNAMLRAQAFTLLVRAYDELRRAIAFIRYHEGDVDEIVPSLYAGRGGRPRIDDANKGIIAPRPQMAPTPVSDVPIEPPPVSKDGPFR